MKTHKIFHLVLGIIFIFSLLGTPGTATAQDPGPIIWGVITSSNWITGQNWPINAVVWINIDDPSTPQNPDSTAIQNTNANGSFNHQSQYDISTGFVISVTDGNITKWVTISDFEVTEFDAKTKTLSGIGSPNTTAAIWILNPQGNVSFVIDPTGHWQVNLTGIADIKPWSRGFAIEQDLDGDGTQSNWPPHYIEASINGPGHSVTGYDWHLGTSITLTVDNPGNGAGIDRTDIQTVEPGNWGTTQVDFHLGDFGLEPGSLVTLTDGAIIQHHTVAYLDITDIDTETDNIFGKAEPGAIVEVNFHDGNQLVWRHVNAVQSGDWVVDFSTPGLGDDEQSLIDIQPGKGFSTRQYDDGGNSTRLYWVVPKYRVVAYSDGDMIIATDFWPGTPVTITVDDPDNGVGIDLTRSGVVSTDPGGWECQTWWGYCFVLDLGGEFDVQAGQLITITDGIRTRSHVVTTLQITDVNWVNSTISGIAEPLSEINLDLWPSCGQRHLFANASGNWIEDFSIPGDENFEQEPCDFSTDELRDIIAYQKSGDGETWVSREISTPRFMLNIYNDSSWHEVTAWNWPLGAQVTLTVDDPGTPQNPDYTEVKTMGPRSGSYPTGASYLQNNEFDGHPGFTITLSDGIQTKSMLVPQLQGTEYNLEDDTVSGLTDPFARVVVACDVGAEPTVIADSGGNWMANFRDLENPEVVLYDIKPGTWCEPQMTDNDYDHIVLRNWSVPLNQPPQITSISAPVYPVQINQTVEATTSFNDPDVSDIHTILWAWGDGTSTTTSAIAPSVTNSHTYATPGVYTVTVTITDAAGVSDTKTLQYIVVYNPDGGFVTGGGWIWSPEGAYTADLSMAGKATFGFVSKYQKGANIPSGNTEFQFKVANLNFKSTSYEWLVIAGSKAQYKGMGMINGAGEYKFMLTAVDDSPDKFRIKIWDQETGEVIYDNQLGTDDMTMPSTEIQGGLIVIHKEK